jgi:peroxiredoxin
VPDPTGRLSEGLEVRGAAMVTAEVGLPIGSAAPDFRDLAAADGGRYSLSSFADPVLVIVFLGNGCPTVKGYTGRLLGLQRDFGDKGVRVVGINSNNAAISPPDTYEMMVKRAHEAEFNFTYLKDEDRHVAKEFGAICTPHVFAFDHARLLQYKGRIDDSRMPLSVTRQDLRSALDDLLSRRPVRTPETEPFGCSVVW